MSILFKIAVPLSKVNASACADILMYLINNVLSTVDPLGQYFKVTSALYNLMSSLHMFSLQITKHRESLNDAYEGRYLGVDGGLSE